VTPRIERRERRTHWDLATTVTEERIEGPTPSGGAYALAYFSAGGVPVDKAQADAVEVIEFTADGAEIARTYADLPGTVSPA
jgi:hypothetical protein